MQDAAICGLILVRPIEWFEKYAPAGRRIAFLAVVGVVAFGVAYALVHHSTLLLDIATLPFC